MDHEVRELDPDERRDQPAEPADQQVAPQQGRGADRPAGDAALVEEDHDLPAVAARVARERGTTYVLMGPPRVRRGLGRLGEPLPSRLLRAMPDVDLRIVADRGRRKEEA